MTKRIAAIKSQLRKGDMTTVALIVGCSADYVRRIIKYPKGHYGHRNPDTDTGRKIILACERIISDRKKTLKAFQTSKNKAA